MARLTPATPTTNPEGMKKMTLPYIHEFTKRGQVFRYVRKAGKKVRLRLAPEHQDFLAEYQAALVKLKGPPPSDPGALGSWNALIDTYLDCAHFEGLRESTKAENKRECRYIRARWGTKPVDRLEACHVLKWQDELKKLPGKANNMLACVKMLLKFGRGRKFKTPAYDEILEIKELKIGELRGWTEAELAKFEAKWEVGTRERLIYALALYTGQRKADLLAMTRAHIDVGFIGVAQQKTGVRLAIPIHRRLSEAIDAMDVQGLALIARLDGQPLRSRELHDVFASATQSAGLEGCVLHGLRKAATRRLIEAGASDAEVMAITGHETAEMLKLYSKGKNQKRLATQAMLKLWENRNGT